MLWYVMLGSAVGGGARFLLGSFVQARMGTAFPTGTLLVNVTGSLVLGFIFRYAAGSSMSPEVRALLTTGFCGGYTTFSTFSWESVRLIEDGDYYRAAWYIGLSVVLSLAGAFVGIGLAREALELRRRV
ncbi:MAG: fluoride efflux transporter CrcB [Gemmatimonadales bacterium]